MDAASPFEALGSDSWAGADYFVEGSEYHLQALTLFERVNWGALTSLCSRFRDGIPCRLSESYSVGQFNIVRRVAFDDGVNWVAKLRMPHIDPKFKELNVERVAKVEVGSLKFLKAKTSIPVPEVHSYNTDPENEVGAPYILLDYIHGTVAEELRCAKGCDPDVYGTPDQDHKFRAQMAAIQAEIASFAFDQIGSLYQDDRTSEFFIGPDVTGKGPWMTSTDYYSDLADDALRLCMTSAEPEVHMSPSFTLPIIFKHLMTLYGAKNSIRGPFRLMNWDFGAHNLLVNGDFDIVGVIDLDEIMAAPIEAVAQFPRYTGMERNPPGHVETKPLAVKRMELAKPRIKRYRDLMEAAEAAIPSNKGRPPIADFMTTDAASIFQGLMEYDAHQDWANDEWMEAYLRLLHKYIESGVKTLYRRRSLESDIEKRS